MFDDSIVEEIRCYRKGPAEKPGIHRIFRARRENQEKSKRKGGQFEPALPVKTGLFCGIRV